MSRTKKSRKPATAPKAKPKLSKKELSQVEKRTKKLTGKKPGNRQLEAQKKVKKTSSSIQKDPRIGSKKPIVLIKETHEKKTTVEKIPSKVDIAPIHFVEEESLVEESLVDEIIIDEDALMAELTAIEQDEKLHTISAKAEFEISEEEIIYFNDKMERHQELCLLLGIEYGEQGDDSVAEPGELDEDALWDKLDSNDFIDDLNDDLSK